MDLINGEGMRGNAHFCTSFTEFKASVEAEGSNQKTVQIVHVFIQKASKAVSLAKQSIWTLPDE
jgi:hypothetical protein